MKRINEMFAIAAAALIACAACSNNSDNSSALLGNGSGPTTYAIKAADGIEHGSVTASPERAAQGATVTLTITPDIGYDLDTVTATSGGSSVALSGDEYTRTFTMPAADVTVAAAFKALPAGFVKVAGGTVVGGDKFKVGSNYGVFVAGRTVTLSTFYMCDHEVTQSEYQAVMGANPSYYNGSSGVQATPEGETQGDRPVEIVSWFDAIYYCNKKSIDETLTPCYSVDGKTNPTQWGYTPHGGNSISGTITCDIIANGYRLPTEAEWEDAALGGKAGTAAADPTDWAGTNTESELKDYAWYIYNTNKTHAVKQKKKNGLGLFDMSGNVWEWCWDLYSVDPKAGDGGQANVTDPLGAPSGNTRVNKGGGFGNSAPSAFPIARRSQRDPNSSDNEHGFRVVRSVVQ